MGLEFKLKVFGRELEGKPFFKRVSLVNTHKHFYKNTLLKSIPAFFAWLHRSFVCRLYIFPSFIKCVPHCLNSKDTFFPYHPPAFLTPAVSLFNQKIRRKTGIDDAGLHFVISVFKPFDRLAEILCLYDFACINIPLCVAFMYVAVKTSLTAFSASSPGVPHRHNSYLSCILLQALLWQAGALPSCTPCRMNHGQGIYGYKAPASALRGH